MTYNMNWKLGYSYNKKVYNIVIRITQWIDAGEIVKTLLKKTKESVGL